MVNIDITGIHHFLYLSWLTTPPSNRHISFIQRDTFELLTDLLMSSFSFFFLGVSTSQNERKDICTHQFQATQTQTFRFARSMHGPPFPFRKYLRQQELIYYFRKRKKNKKDQLGAPAFPFYTTLQCQLHTHYSPPSVPSHHSVLPLTVPITSSAVCRAQSSHTWIQTDGWRRGRAVTAIPTLSQ